MTEQPSEKTTTVLQRVAQPVRITLTRGMRGAYGWTIEVHAEDSTEALYQLDTINDYLQGRYIQNLRREGLKSQPKGTEEAENV